MPNVVGDLVELLLREPVRVLAQVGLGGHSGHRGPAYSTLKETCARFGFAASGSVGHAARRSS